MSRATEIARRLQLFAVSKLGITLGVLLLIYTLAGFFAAPWLLRQQLPKLISEQLGGRATVEDIRINPLLFKAEVQGLAIAEASGLRAFEIGLLRVNFELSSLLRWAWTFSEIRIERPVIHADLDAGESLNLARLFAPRGDTPEDKPRGDGKLPRLVIQHLAISNGAFRFTDHTLEPAAKTQLDPVNFEIHDVSTLPDYDGNHRLSARLPGGGSLLWEGRLSLAPIESTAKITLSGAKLSTPWQFVRDHLTIAEPGGSYGLNLRYRMGYSGGKTAFSISELGFMLQDLLIAQQGSSTPLVKLGSFALEDGSFELESRTLTFNNVRVADGALNITLDQDGVPDLARLVRTPAPVKAAAVEPAAKTPAETAAAPAKPWQISLPLISIGPLALALRDNSRVTPLQATVAQIEATLAASLAVGTQTQATVDNAALKVREVVVRPAGQQESVITLAEAELGGGAFDLQAQTARAALVRLNGGRTMLNRDAQGMLQLSGMLTPMKEKPPQKSGLAATIDRLEFLNYAIALADQGFQPPLAYDFEQISLTASRLANPPKGVSPVELLLKVKQGGTLKAKGTLDLLRETADIRLELAQLALAPLDTVLKRDTTLTLASGTAGAAGRVQWNGRRTPGAVRYTGNAAIDALELRTAADRERLLGWKRLALTEVDADLGENRMAIAHIGLTQPYARLLINKDKSTNLAKIRRTPASAPATATAAAATAPATSAAPAAAAESPAMAVNVERVSIEGGSMDFTDLSLVLPFATFIKDLNGSASGLSSSPDSRASLRLEGGIADYGLARAEGTIQPFAPKKFTDILVNFRNVELTPMTPYTATFAGRRIASGKLSLDLQYKVDNSKLAGNNKLLLDKFTLGERVESPTAVSLPLDLAIALLTDGKGQIDLALPVSGDVDSPEFSYGHLIWQAIRTVLTRIVTAPFRALGALFGGNAETLGDIVFDAGGSRVLPTEQEKLRRVAEGLEKRPQLKLQVQGTWHKDVDARALRTAAVRADLAAREGTRLAPGEDPGPVGFDNAKTQRALEQMLEGRAGGNAVTQFAEAYRKSSGREGSRVNAALALVGRGAGDRGLYIAMHQRLIELQPLPAAALADLAKARAEAISTALVKTLKFDPARLSAKTADAVDEAAKNGVPAKLSFEPLK
ncbi:MAG: DUF748 domain-containing protein [Burkholderiales bacterium]|nr:DUF748 domain-containing protein [Burkholderiales bacterium]